MTRAIVFKTPGTLDIRAITTFGVNSKPNSTCPIGFFGTGLKYAIAVLLRTNHQVIIRTPKDEYHFEKRPGAFRDKEFDFIYMVRKTSWFIKQETQMPFTTELGKHWVLWQAFRELYANTLDEHGNTTLLEEFKFSRATNQQIEQTEQTEIIVVGDDFAIEYLEREKTFLPDALQTQQTDKGVQHFVKPSQHVYYRGLRVMDLEKPSKLTYNILQKIDLTEDRTAKNSWDVEQKIRDYVTQSDDEELIQIVTSAPEGSYENRFNFTNCYSTPSSAFSSAIRNARRSGSLKGVNPTALTYVETYDPETREDVKKEQKIPEIGSEWRHKNGNTYRVVLVANEKTPSYKQDEYPITICYSPISDLDTVWARTFDRWYSSMTLIED